MNFDSVETFTIPEGNVKQIEIGGQKVWAYRDRWAKYVSYRTSTVAYGEEQHFESSDDSDKIYLDEFERLSGSIVYFKYYTGYSYSTSTGKITGTGAAEIYRYANMRYSLSELDKLVGNYIEYDGHLYHVRWTYEGTLGDKKEGHNEWQHTTANINWDYRLERGPASYMWKYQLTEYVKSEDPNAYPATGSIASYYSSYNDEARTTYIKQT